MTRSSGFLVLALVLGLSVGWIGLRLVDRFPHREHEGVFPLCTGCHAGIETGDRTAWYPDSTNCERCHDGETEERVEWTPPRDEPSNLAFDHPRHAEAMVAAEDSAARCQTCHRSEEGEGRMAVGAARPELCLQCHAHEVAEHLAPDAACRRCHVPLTEAAELPVERVEAFPTPATHEASDFVADHRPAPDASVSCAVCHARESCERCHLNAPRVPLIDSLATDERVASLTAGQPAEYPLPSSHERGSWDWQHAEAAERDAVGCGNCHARPSCQSCHGASDDSVFAVLARPRPGGPQGVVIADGRPRVHGAGFATTHGPEAAAGEDRCLDCHTQQQFCLDCHEGPGESRFHGANFRERHAAQAYGADEDCAACHNVEVFCRGCHVGSGLASGGRRDVAFHTARPFWLLSHGQSARQQLESCASCHAQTDCAQCHSAVGAWRINPHGRGFDGERARDRNELTCRLCHRRIPGEP